MTSEVHLNDCGAPRVQSAYFKVLAVNVVRPSFVLFEPQGDRLQIL
jgi:hypothetical protein